jgi:hypothetical protein
MAFTGRPCPVILPRRSSACGTATGWVTERLIVEALVPEDGIVASVRAAGELARARMRGTGQILCADGVMV